MEDGYACERRSNERTGHSSTHVSANGTAVVAILVPTRTSCKISSPAAFSSVSFAYLFSRVFFFFFLKNLLLSSWVVILEQRQTGSLVFFCFLALVKAELYIPVCVCVRPAWFLCLCFDTVKLTAAASNILVRLLKPAWLQGARFLRCCDVQGLT